MAERGFLDSSRISNVFNMMRPRDLIWPYMVNNYLLGRKPMPFDILYWNQDSTRMPAANHKFYLREFYNANRLARGDMVVTGTTPSSARPGTMRPQPETSEDHILFYLQELRGETRLPPVEMSFKSFRLNLKKVTIPIFELATKDDHIAPAVSVFKGARLFGSDAEFVLAGSGHIAGVINPPAKPKYQYWTDGCSGAPSLEDWFASATEHPGSWWQHWAGWLAKQSGGWVTARVPGARLGVIEDAPGSYVKVRAKRGHLSPWVNIEFSSRSHGRFPLLSRDGQIRKITVRLPVVRRNRHALGGQVRGVRRMEHAG
jgi:polyhydroxyalkanoate synthase